MVLSALSVVPSVSKCGGAAARVASGGAESAEGAQGILSRSPVICPHQVSHLISPQLFT